MVTLYYVGPKGQDNGKPWLSTGNREVAEKYAQEMDGEVRTKEVQAPVVWLNVRKRP